MLMNRIYERGANQRQKGRIIGNIPFLRKLKSAAWGREVTFLGEGTLLPSYQKERTKDGHRHRWPEVR